MSNQVPIPSAFPGAHTRRGTSTKGYGFETVLGDFEGSSRALDSTVFLELMNDMLLGALAAYGVALSNHARAVDPAPAKREHSPKRFQFSEEALQSTLDERFAMYEVAPPGWDGYSGLPLNKKSLIHAKQFLRLRPEGIRLPHPQLSPLGDVGLYWKTDDLLVDITFFEDGTFNYFTWQKLGDEEEKKGGDDGCEVGEWPPEMQAVLRTL